MNVTLQRLVQPTSAAAYAALGAILLYVSQHGLPSDNAGWAGLVVAVLSAVVAIVRNDGSAPLKPGAIGAAFGASLLIASAAGVAGCALSQAQQDKIDGVAAAAASDAREAVKVLCAIHNAAGSVVVVIVDTAAAGLAPGAAPAVQAGAAALAAFNTRVCATVGGEPVAPVSPVSTTPAPAAL